MLPGVERAVMQIGEMMSSLVSAVEKLTKAIEHQPKRCNHKPDEDISLYLILTADEWQEVANAISVRHRQVAEDEPEDVDMSREQIEKWANTLNSAYTKLTRVLDTFNIVY